MRILKYAVKNIIRNPLLSISSIFVIALLIFFVNVLLLVLFASGQFIESVNDRISFTINYQSGYSSNDVQAKVLIDDLRTSFSGIVVENITKADAFALLKSRNPDLANLIEYTGENPLPDSLRIDNIPLDQYKDFDTRIAQEKEMLHYDQDAMNRKLLDYKGQFARVSLVVKLLHMLQYGVYALVGLFIFTVAMIIYTVIGNSVFFQRQEIEIIELVGGQKSFIYGPFLIQGALYSLIATLIVLSLIMLIRSLVHIDFISGPFALLGEKITLFFPTLFLEEILVFLFLGIVSSLIALQRYIRT